MYKMKLLRSKFLLLTLAKGQSSWEFVIPAGMISCAPGEQLKIYAKKVIYRNDFTVLTAGRDTFLVDGQPYAVRHGSPNALLFAGELSTKHPDLAWSFEGYDGRLYVNNISSTETHVIAPGTLGGVLGLETDLTLGPGESAAMPYSVDLAPPETIYFRMGGLISSSFEVKQGSVDVGSLLVAIGSDVVPYQTKVYKDSEGLYGHMLQVKALNELQLSLEDAEGTPIASHNPITVILAIEWLVDDQGATRDLLQQSLELTKLSLLQGDISSKT